MTLSELIKALAGEIELVTPELERSVATLATEEAGSERFMDALDHYSGQVERMGHAAEMAGFPGLYAVCLHVQENAFLLATQLPAEREATVQFLLRWPTLVVTYLRHLNDPSSAAGLIDHLRHAPSPLPEEQSLRIMHQLGALPMQATLSSAVANQPTRAVLAKPEDVMLNISTDVDEKLLEGFFQESPGMVQHLVTLVRNMASGQGDSSDLVAAKRIVHTLKGTGSTIGLRGITALSHQLEDILEHLEGKAHAPINAAVAQVLLDAAYCLEQMVSYLQGTDDAPVQSQAVLQSVLDLANRIDRGDTLEEALARAPAPQDTSSVADQPSVSTVSPYPARVITHTPAAALRVNLQRIDALFRVSGEISVHTAAIESRIEQLAEQAKALIAQNTRLQRRLFELETLLDARVLDRRAHATEHALATGFDALEMDQYSEVHSTSHALAEEAADARILAHTVQDGILQLQGMQTRQELLSRDLQHLVISTRMTEVNVLESRLQRNVRITAQNTGKLAHLQIEGGETLIDSDVLNRLAEPLLHLLRNAVDHGIEPPLERKEKGKREAGLITLTFMRQGQQVVLRCQDDGRGLDFASIQRRGLENGLISAGQALSRHELARLILMPNFSTRDNVSEISGRGVGLDVVRDWVSGMNGNIAIDINTPVGTCIELRFAASLSTVQSLVVQVQGQRYALPSVQIEQAVPRGLGRVERAGNHLRYHLGERVITAHLLANLVDLPSESEQEALDACDVVLVNLHNKQYALLVDSLIDARELLVKSASRYLRHIPSVAGLSVLGDGNLAVHLDLQHLLERQQSDGQPVRARRTLANRKSATETGILIVDDSLSVRNSLQQLVQDAGFKVETARDGMDAINVLRTFRPQLLLTDLEMPNMNGVELTTHIRAREDLKTLPIIMITSRSQDKHRDLASKAGVDHYITKPYNEADLLRTMRMALAQSAAA